MVQVLLSCPEDQQVKFGNLSVYGAAGELAKDRVLNLRRLNCMHFAHRP